jgi:hypothetical protein
MVVFVHVVGYPTNSYSGVCEHAFGIEDGGGNTFFHELFGGPFSQLKTANRLHIYPPIHVYAFLP